MNPIKLLADENIAAPMVEALREARWDVTYVAEFAPGIGDDDVLRVAGEEHRILLTEDKDFGDLVVRLKKNVTGIILLRLKSGLWEPRWERLRSILETQTMVFHGKYVVIEEDRTRVRKIE